MFVAGGFKDLDINVVRNDLTTCARENVRDIKSQPSGLGY